MSLADVSARTGIHKSHLSRVESGKAGLSDDNVALLAEALGATPADITHEEPAVTTPRGARKPKIREDIPLPNTPEGALFQYTPAEAAQWTPFTELTLREMVRLRKIPHTFNGRRTSFTGQQICDIASRYVVEPFEKPARTAA